MDDACGTHDSFTFTLQDIPGCGKFRKLSLQNEDELAICFGDITNIGGDHWSPRVANIGVPNNPPPIDVDQ